MRRIAPLLAAATVGGLFLGTGTGVALARPRAATPDLIEHAVAAGRIDRDQGNLYIAYALGHPAKLPAAYRADVPWDGTLPLRHVTAALRAMRAGPSRDRLADALAPAAAGTSCSSSSGALAGHTPSAHFYVEYGTIAGGLTASDYVASLEQSWSTEVTSFGWAAPPLMTTPDGPRYHVRVDALQNGLYGFTAPSGTYAGLVGNNPNTSWNDVDAYASCIVLNDDYTGFPSPPQASLDATTAHEFNHALQYGYGAITGANTPDDAFVEGGATWMEDEVFNASNDNYNYLWPVFGDSMGAYSGSPYAYWITFRGLTERFGHTTAGGGEQVMQDFWEETSKSSTSNELPALNTALLNKGPTLAAAYHDYAIAAKFDKPCGGGYVHPYCFDEAAGYAAAAGATPVDHTIASVGGSTTGKVEDNYALQWVALPASASPYDVTLSNTSTGGSLRATVACDTGTTLVLSPLPVVVGAGLSSTLSGFDPSACTSRVLVITNESQTAANPTSSSARNYSVSTAAAGPRTLTVTRNGTGSGTVTSTNPPGGINCGADCTEPYAQGTSVTLSATAAGGSTFAGWSGGGCSGTGTCTVTMDANTTVTATFNTTPPPSFTLTVSKAGTGSGTVTSSPGGINCGATCSASFSQGTAVVLTATPASGSVFAGWSGDCAGSGTCNLTMNAAHAATATFNASSGGGGGGGTGGGGTGGGGTGGTTTTPTTTTTPVITTLDTTKPVIGSPRLAATTFRAAKSGPSIAVTTGTRVGYLLSEAARTTFRVRKALPGRRVGGRCVAPTRANRTRPRCTRYVLLRGSFSRQGTRGANSFRFRGRLAGKTLRPGRYRLVMYATDAAGNRSATRSLAFRIVA